MSFHHVFAALTRAFRALGRFLARYPWPVILVCILVAGGFAAGFVEFKLEEE